METSQAVGGEEYEQDQQAEGLPGRALSGGGREGGQRVPPAAEPGMEMLTNSQVIQVTIEGNNVENLKQLVRQVGYLNRQFEFEKIVADI